MEHIPGIAWVTKILRQPRDLRHKKNNVGIKKKGSDIMTSNDILL